MFKSIKPENLKVRTKALLLSSSDYMKAILDELGDTDDPDYSETLSEILSEVVKARVLVLSLDILFEEGITILTKGGD